MNLKHKLQSTKLDHIQDTLTNMVGVVGETRQDVKQLGQKIDEVKQEQVETRKDIACL